MLPPSAKSFGLDEEQERFPLLFFIQKTGVAPDSCHYQSFCDFLNIAGYRYRVVWRWFAVVLLVWFPEEDRFGLVSWPVAFGKSFVLKVQKTRFKKWSVFFNIFGCIQSSSTALPFTFSFCKT